MVSIEPIRWFYQSLSLRTKLVAVIMVPVSCLISIILVTVAWIEIRQTKQSMAVTTRSVIRAMSQDFERMELLDDQSVAVDIVDRLRSFETIELVYVYNLRDEVVFAYRRSDIAATEPPRPRNKDTEFWGSSLSMFVPLRSSKRQFGVAYVQTSIDQLDRGVRRAIATTVMTGGTTMVFGLGLAAILQRFISQPILELEHSAKLITLNRDYSVRTIKRAGDELGAVADAFNAMLEQIERREAALRRAHDNLERRVVERTAILASTNKQLHEEIAERKAAALELKALQARHVAVARNAGMAEVATSVLHNVGNVLNSVNVSVSLICEKLRKLGVADLARAVAIMHEHREDLGEYITRDQRGKHLPRFLVELSRQMAADEQEIVQEVQSLSTNIDHIKHIVSLQQSLAGTSGLIEEVSLAELLEDAIRINSSSIARHRIEIVRQFQALPHVAVDKQKLLQILVNLISNAKYALIESEHPEKQLVVRMSSSSGEQVRIEVEDNGVGIPPENLKRLFTYGFTTKKDGHGFGLHSAALAAKEMKWTLSARSDGPGTGATLTLELPFKETGVSLCAN